ncbi:N-acetylglucosamine-6-phosphate deacetylase [Pelagibius sp. Alg239-R121]|uniref:N-acetylglucosamine-6-phosphate deacetylase n=1 Tax=Pelagibius sp. Alg239-R121 TaxID=2993448 RepID=UPI0024A65E05|nr:N-acetylglucosamine-6-phosphate deacetylase [Pelagibius sp. Alg239-R121]
MQTDGLFDLQVNGYAGVDFNDEAITPDQVDVALEALLTAGVTGCLPTVITAHPHKLDARLRALDAAVTASRLGHSMVPGYHLEGPFLNASAGYDGCHPPEAMIDPDAELVFRLEEPLVRPILLVTLAPERLGAVDAVKRLTKAGKTVSMGHSAAGFATVRAAANAGMTLSTHLGNGLPQQLPKLENALLAQLAESRLKASLIADGHHMSPEALEALVSIKGKENCILVTDAVVAAGSEPGSYRFAGMDIQLDERGTVLQPGQSNLAGSALGLDKAVRNVCAWSIATPQEAARMASVQARAAIASALKHHGIRLDAGQVSWNSGLEPSVQVRGCTSA